MPDLIGEIAYSTTLTRGPVRVFTAVTAYTGGAKRLTATLTTEQAALLAAQPPLASDRDSVLAGHLAAAEAFLPRARRLLGHQQVPWPAAFAAATYRHLQQTLALNVTCPAEPQTGSENTHSRQ